MLPGRPKSSTQPHASHHGRGPGALHRAPGGVQRQHPGGGPGGSTPGSSGGLPILNALGELS